jgi:monothiol glutaredoxin
MNSFQVNTNTASTPIEEIPTFYETSNVTERIQKIIKDNPVVIFMKGNAQAPMCGFSANSCMILKKFNAPFKTYDILKDAELRQAIKDFSNWPTFPQLYIKGNLVGGNDILTELAQNGELTNLLKF